MFSELAAFFHEGGPTMFVTATAGVIGISVSIERAMKFWRDYNLDNRVFMGRIKELMVQNRLEDAVQYCTMERKGLLPDVVKAGLERVGCDEELVRQSMESAYLDQVPKITGKLAYVSLIANAGMLFGLLGTVLGLIRQFAAVGSADAGQKQLLMAKGIAESMNNTALGLMVALPCLIIHAVLAARAQKLAEELERGAAQTLDWIGLFHYGELQKKMSNGHGKKAPHSAAA